MTLKNKVAIVTGAGGGIGRAIAVALGEAGAAVVVNDVGVSLCGCAVRYALARLSHRGLVKVNDEPKILCYTIRPLCPTGADGLQLGG